MNPRSGCVGLLNFILLQVSAVSIAGCVRIPAMGGPSTDGRLPVVEPGRVAEKVGEYGGDIINGLGIEGGFDNPNVSPMLCGDASSAKRVLGRNPNRDTWWVDHSPYSEGMITYVEVPSEGAINEALVRLKAVLERSGWKTVEFGLGSSTEQAVLSVAAPEKGYGAVLQGITSVPGHPRIGVDISSPCVRHPGAR